MNKLYFVALASLAGVAAQAQITSVGSFSGSLDEGFEGFNNYAQGPFNLPNPTSIMGGAASLITTSGVVYQPGYASFGLASHGSAQVSDGAKGLGLDRSSGTASVSFSSPVSRFGGYFNYVPDLGNAITFRFFAEDGTQIGSDVLKSVPGSGMEFMGFSSTTAIKRVDFSGDYVVADGLRADVQAVPEPASMAALGLGALGILKRRKRSA